MGFYWRGRWYRESCKTTSKRFAGQRELARKSEIQRNEFIPMNAGSLKLSALIAKYLEWAKVNKKETRTDSVNLNRFLRYFGDIAISKIKNYDIERYKMERVRASRKNASQKVVRPASVNRELATLRTMLNKAVAWKDLRASPFTGIKLFRVDNGRVRFLSSPEMTRLIDSAKGYIRDAIILALNTGMRRGELLRLQWTDIDLENGIIHVNETKSGYSRKLPINSNVLELLKGQTFRTGYVIHEGEGLRIFDIKKAFASALKRAGITEFHFHDLRHTFASHLVMAGVDLMTVRELLGHKTIEMTLRYSHLSPDHKLAAIKKIEKRMSENYSKPCTMETGKREVAETLEK